jgi:hypothetical protein
MGYYIDNSEQKIRISLSERAKLVINDDMFVFSVSSPSTFINRVFENFYKVAKSSVSLFLTTKHNEYQYLLAQSNMSAQDQESAITCLLSKDEQQIVKEVTCYLKDKSFSRLYHLNRSNLEYLLSDRCVPDEIYKGKAGAYIKCILEEYTNKPFIERARIYKQDVYDAIDRACRLNELLEITLTTPSEGQRTFLVHPYKIVPDLMNTQEYLVCYTRRPDESPKSKRPASFAVSRLETPKLLRQKSFISNEDVKKLEQSIKELSPAFLLGEMNEIKVKLTSKGKQIFKNKLYARPTLDLNTSNDEEYVFFCSEFQAINYFLPFGPEAEIVSPKSLRDKIRDIYQSVVDIYR